MSFSVSAVSQNNSFAESELTQKAAPKLTEAAQIKLLAEQGHSNQQIATATGLPVTLVESTLGDTSSTSTSSVSQASALLALGSRLSVHA